MIILDADEEQIAQSRAVMESNSDSGRKVLASSLPAVFATIAVGSLYSLR